MNDQQLQTLTKAIIAGLAPSIRDNQRALLRELKEIGTKPKYATYGDLMRLMRRDYRQQLNGSGEHFL